MTHLAHIASRVLNRPLLITPDKAQTILSVLGSRIGANAPEASRFEGDRVRRDEEGNPVGIKPYRVKNGVGVITIDGELVNRGAWIGASSGLTSYEGIQHQLRSAKNDGEAESVILDLSTLGGEAIGAMETAAVVRDVAATKRVVAVVNGMAASAGYAIASGASEIVTTETGVSGSIGVVMLHADYSKMLEGEGVDPTLIFAGAHKTDGNPFEPLSDSVRSDLQEQVNVFYSSFLRNVAAGRGNRLTETGARKTEARTFIGQKAVDAGVADRVGHFDEVLVQLSQRAPGGHAPSSQNRRVSMSENTGQPATESAGITQADFDKAKADAKFEGEAAGATAERTRLTAIVQHDDIKGSAKRMTAGLDLAAKSPGMPSDDIVAFVTGNVAADAAKPDTSLAGRNAVPDSLADAGHSEGAPPASNGKTGWDSVAKTINGRQAAH